MTILVTGGAGYIGSHTVRALRRAGHPPVVLDNLGDSLTLLEALKAEGERRGTPPLQLVFSSTCASYGIPAPEQIPIAESCPQRPINPDGTCIRDYIHVADLAETATGGGSTSSTWAMAPATPCSR